MTQWAGISGLVRELKRCEEAGHLTGSLVLAYVCIDTMAFLSLPEDRSQQTREDFIRWVDTYLKGHADQPYPPGVQRPTHDRHARPGHRRGGAD